MSENFGNKIVHLAANTAHKKTGEDYQIKVITTAGVPAVGKPYFTSGSVDPEDMYKAHLGSPADWNVVAIVEKGQTAPMFFNPDHIVAAIPIITS